MWAPAPLSHAPLPSDDEALTSPGTEPRMTLWNKCLYYAAVAPIAPRRRGRPAPCLWPVDARELAGAPHAGGSVRP